MASQRKIVPRPRILVLVALLAALASGLALSPPRRLVLVSFDGAGGRDLEERLEAGAFSPDGFAKARKAGFSAERLVEVTPSLTAVSHAAISAGAPASATGIVLNWFHPAAAPLGARVSGFETESGVETIWEAALRQGKRVASIGWPGLTLQSPRTSVPVAMRFDDSKERGAFVKLLAKDFSDALVALPLGVRSFSPPRTWTSPSKTLAFTVVDGSDDGRRNYDAIFVDTRGGPSRVRPGEWFALTRRADEGAEKDVLFGRWAKLLALAPDLSSVVVYVGTEHRNVAAPEDFRRTLDTRAGFWPGSPDASLLESATPDVTSYLEQIARFGDFFTKAFEVADRRGDWDLLLAYQPIVDEAAHTLLLADARQPGYTPERAEKAAAALREVWKVADHEAARYLAFAERGDVVFVSDHGLCAAWRSYYLLDALRRHRWLQASKGPRGPVVAPDSPVDAAVGGGMATIFVNRALTMPGGVVSGTRAAALVDEMAAYFKSLVDDDDRPLFATVAKAAELGALGLDHPNAGDLVLIAANGTTIRPGFAPGGDGASLFAGPEELGRHGYGPDPELDGIFFHVGDGITPERVPTFRAVDVAARVAGRLGIEGPRGKR